MERQSEEQRTEKVQKSQDQEQVEGKFSIFSFLFSSYDKKARQSQDYRLQPEEKQLRLKEIERNWHIVEHVESEESARESDSQQENEEKDQSEQVSMLKAQVESLTLVIERLELEKKVLEIENTKMREEIEKWIKDPHVLRRYAQIQGYLIFEEDCDEVKMEKRSLLQGIKKEQE